MMRIVLFTLFLFLTTALSANPYWEAIAAGDYEKASAEGMKLAEQQVEYLYLSAVADQFRFAYDEYYNKKEYFLELTQGDLQGLQSLLATTGSPENANACNIYGFISLTLEGISLDAPISYFEKSLSLTEENPFAYNYTAFIAISDERYDEGISEAIKAITLMPALPEAYNNLAYAYSQVGEEALAQQTLITCLARCPKNTLSTYYNLMHFACEETVIMIDSAMVSGPGFESDEVREQVVEALSPYPANMIDFASAFTSYQGYQEAALLLAAVKPQEELHGRYYYERGVLAVRTGQKEAINDAFAELLAKDNFPAALDIAYEVYGTQDFDLMLRLLRRLQPLADTEEEKMQVNSNIGTVYLQQGEYIKAISVFESVLEYAPKDDITLTNLGISWHLAGDNEKALSYLSRAQEYVQSEEQAASITRWLQAVREAGD